MKVAQIRTQRQFTIQDWKQYHIQSYGEYNDFPQAVDEIVTASKTGNACLGIYADFIYGSGFKDAKIGGIAANDKGQELNKVLRMAVKDFAKWHGFALHVNYNANMKVRSVSHVPFETLRLHMPDDSVSSGLGAQGQVPQDMEGVRHRVVRPFQPRPRDNNGTGERGRRLGRI